jgi:hypothetical protein
MFQFTYKLKVAERVKAKCNRHPPHPLFLDSLILSLAPLSHNPRLSFTAMTSSCSDPRYRSVV